ncbi:hypothetical protein CYMTET_29282, partial [Cymbomonas tetramitiformis]
AIFVILLICHICTFAYMAKTFVSIGQHFIDQNEVLRSAISKASIQGARLKKNFPVLLSGTQAGSRALSTIRRQVAFMGLTVRRQKAAPRGTDKAPHGSSPSGLSLQPELGGLEGHEEEEKGEEEGDNPRHAGSRTRMVTMPTLQLQPELHTEMVPRRTKRTTKLTTAESFVKGGARHGSIMMASSTSLATCITRPVLHEPSETEEGRAILSRLLHAPQSKWDNQLTNVNSPVDNNDGSWESPNGVVEVTMSPMLDNGVESGSKFDNPLAER